MPIARILTVVLVLTLSVVSVAVYGDLPDRIPVHLDGAGTADRWGDKSLGTWLLVPGIATAVALLLLVVGSLAPRYPALFNYPGKERVLALPPERRGPSLERVRAMLDWTALSIVVTLGLVQYSLYQAALGRDSKTLLFVAVGVGIFGPIAGIAVESIRINRLIDAARG